MDCPRRPNVIKRFLKWKEGGKRVRVREEYVNTKAEIEVACKHNSSNASSLYTLKKRMDPTPPPSFQEVLPTYFRLLSSRTIMFDV